MKKNHNSSKKRWRRSLISGLNLFMLAALYAVLAWSYLAFDSESLGLARHADRALFESGVTSRVTAVLLNYRAYDTLLECFVLFLGVVAVWSLRSSSFERRDPPLSPILASLVRLLVPLMLMVGGYLLWAGSHQAGGAFQAGAIWGGVGVLLILTSSPLLSSLPRRLLPLGICLGPFFFVLIALGAMVFGSDFLGYRQEVAAKVIVVLETVAAISIGLTLAGLFDGGSLEDPHQKAAMKVTPTEQEKKR
nr:sodium:proton antiporter [Desulfobulbaceae bacterium]